MHIRPGAVIWVLMVLAGFHAEGQQDSVQNGLLFKKGTGIRLSGIRVQNKRNSAMTNSTIIGTFSIPARKGDTLEITGDGYENSSSITDLNDRIIFLKPQILLSEVVIKENTIGADLNATQNGYRKKGVFYTGTPHYYYLFLKPMTFIYENFKSEVINARRFKRIAKDERAYYEINTRFNQNTIKKVVPIADNEIDGFEEAYWPSLSQIRNWNDYDLDNYIIHSYSDFKRKHLTDAKDKNL